MREQNSSSSSSSSFYFFKKLHILQLYWPADSNASLGGPVDQLLQKLGSKSFVAQHIFSLEIVGADEGALLRERVTGACCGSKLPLPAFIQACSVLSGIRSFSRSSHAPIGLLQQPPSQGLYPAFSGPPPSQGKGSGDEVGPLGGSIQIFMRASRTFSNGSFPAAPTTGLHDIL